MDRVVIDAHLHLWNTERLRYEWLQRPENAAINRTFGFEDFRARAVTAGGGPGRPGAGGRFLGGHRCLTHGT